VNAVIPYFGYARQDRKDQPRVSITAKLVANLITQAGCRPGHHDGSSRAADTGVFRYPRRPPVFFGDTREAFQEDAPGEPGRGVAGRGGNKMARAYAKRLEADLIVIDKRRPRPNEAEVMNIIGRGARKNILTLTTWWTPPATLCNAVRALKNAGAKEVFAACTHPVLSGSAIERINASSLTRLVVTDSSLSRRAPPRSRGIGGLI